MRDKRSKPLSRRARSLSARAKKTASFGSNSKTAVQVFARNISRGFSIRFSRRSRLEKARDLDSVFVTESLRNSVEKFLHRAFSVTVLRSRSSCPRRTNSKRRLRRNPTRETASTKSLAVEKKFSSSTTKNGF